MKGSRGHRRADVPRSEAGAGGKRTPRSRASRPGRSSGGYHADRRALDAADRAFRAGGREIGWERLREVLLRHPWRPKRVRRRLKRAR